MRTKFDMFSLEGSLCNDIAKYVESMQEGSLW